MFCNKSRRMTHKPCWTSHCVCEKRRILVLSSGWGPQDEKGIPWHACQLFVQLKETFFELFFLDPQTKHAINCYRLGATHTSTRRKLFCELPRICETSLIRSYDSIYLWAKSFTGNTCISKIWTRNFSQQSLKWHVSYMFLVLFSKLSKLKILELMACEDGHDSRSSWKSEYTWRRDLVGSEILYMKHLL